MMWSSGNRERWLVLNKVDAIDQDEAREIEEQVTKKLSPNVSIHRISAVSGQGCDKLIHDLMLRL